MAVVVPIGEAIVAIAHTVLVILDIITDLNEKRSRFTQDFIDRVRAEYPDYNAVIIHTNHSRVAMPHRGRHFSCKSQKPDTDPHKRDAVAFFLRRNTL